MLAIDDGIVMQQRETPSFSSIDEVVDVCLSLLENYLKSFENCDQIAVTLLGWSYGGVVASEVARKWRETIATPNMTCKGLIVFDAPLRRPKCPHVLPDSGDRIVAQHYSYCTSLLNSYFARQEREGVHDASPSCLFFHYRPFSPEDEGNDVVSSSVRYCVGDHWTMLIGDNALALSSRLVADILFANSADHE